MLIFIICFLISFVISFLGYIFFIPLLKKIKCKQEILGYVTEHKQKSGTPTMGGLIFIIISLVISLFYCQNNNILAILCIAITFSYMVVGFLDDFLKIKNKQNLGLKAYQKIIFQLSIAIVVAIFCYKNSITILYVPFTKKIINVGVFIIPLVILVFLATTNTVNLTDGLDGLAGSTSVIYLLGMCILIFFQLKNNHINYIEQELYNLIFISIVLVGALLGFLIFNTNKASVFMGDTGSLALGGLIACVSIFSGNTLYIAIMGCCFVISGLSVIIQVAYFKLTKGKRVFLMAPIHHHFQKKGLLESKIVYFYTIVTIISCVLSLINYL